MTLVSQIITDGLRESNLIAVGASPKVPEQAEALRRLQNLVSSAIGNDVGEMLLNWPLGNFGRAQDWKENVSTQQLQNPTANCRLIATAEASMTVNLPAIPSAGARVAIVDPLNRLAAFPVTLDANGAAIEGQATLVLSDNGMNRSWFYRDDLGAWLRTTNLDPAQEFPFPDEFDDYFVTKLAMRLNPRYGKAISDLTVARLREQKQDITNRYLQSAPLHINTEASFTSRMSFENWSEMWLGSDSGAWARGGWGWQ